MNKEHQEQCAFIQYMALKHKDGFLFAIPNGGRRDVVTASKLKREGVKAGVPDIFIALPRIPYNGLFLEMKKDAKAYASKAQKQAMQVLESKGYKCDIAYGCDHAIKIFEE